MSPKSNPNLENVNEDIKNYIRSLQDQVSSNDDRREKDRRLKNTWPIERWITVMSFVGMIMVSIFAVGARWNGIDAMDQRMTKIETKMDSLGQAADNTYARRDMSEERWNTLNKKLDDLTSDVKSIKANTIK